jgi:hypothetical protein
MSKERKVKVRMIVALAGVVFISACTTTEVATPKALPSATTQTPSESTEPSEMPVPEPSDSENMRIGQRYQYKDGLTVSVSRPVKFRPSEDAQGGEGVSIKFVVTYTNSSSSSFDPSHVSMRVLSGGVEGHDVYDPSNGLKGEWNTDPLPSGRSRQYVVGFSALDPTEVQITIMTSLDKYEAVTFSS